MLVCFLYIFVSIPSEKNGGDKKLALIQHQRQFSDSPNRHRKTRWMHVISKVQSSAVLSALCNRRPEKRYSDHDLFQKKISWLAYSLCQNQIVIDMKWRKMNKNGLLKKGKKIGFSP